MGTQLGKIQHVIRNEAIIPDCTIKVKRGSNAFVQTHTKSIGSVEYPFGLYDAPYYPIKLNNFGKKIKHELAGLVVTVEPPKRQKRKKRAYSSKKKNSKKQK